MRRNCWIFWVGFILQMSTACSIGKNQKSFAMHHSEKASIDNQAEASFRSFVEKKMEELIIYAKEKNPQFPFAAMIIDTRSGAEICRGINNSSSNPTLHGEIAAINNCVNNVGRDNLDWPNLTLITTAEPCPMCQGAIIWAGIGTVVFGTSIQHLIEKGWRQIDIKSEEVCHKSNFNKPKIVGGVLAEVTDPLFVDRNKK